MTSIVQPITRALRKLAGIVGNLLPAPPSDEAPAPDIDGRRPVSAEETDVKMKAQMRDGRGAGGHQ